MKFFELNFATAMWRFYTIMLVVIGGVLLNLPWLAILALPIFLITLLGMKLELPLMWNRLKKINKKKSMQGRKNVPQFQ